MSFQMRVGLGNQRSKVKDDKIKSMEFGRGNQVEGVRKEPPWSHLECPVQCEISRLK